MIITQFIKNGLEIRFVKDIGSYTKAIYAFKEFSESIIVTADDDIFYPKDWLKKLYLSGALHVVFGHVTSFKFWGITKTMILGG